MASKLSAKIPWNTLPTDVAKIIYCNAIEQRNLERKNQVAKKVDNILEYLLGKSHIRGKQKIFPGESKEIIITSRRHHNNLYIMNFDVCGESYWMMCNHPGHGSCDVFYWEDIEYSFSMRMLESNEKTFDIVKDVFVKKFSSMGVIDYS